MHVRIFSVMDSLLCLPVRGAERAASQKASGQVSISGMGSARAQRPHARLSVMVHLCHALDPARPELPLSSL